MALRFDGDRAHIYVEDESGRETCAVLDMGAYACIDAETTHELTPEQARLLGHALISWSAWKRRIIPTIDHYQKTAAQGWSAEMDRRLAAMAEDPEEYLRNSRREHHA